MELEEEIVQFVSAQLGVDRLDCTMDALIEDDFGMAGLDTLMFYEAFFLHFKIRIPQEFDVERYVTPEVLQPGKMLRSLLSKSYREIHRVRNVSLRHLTEVARQGIWFDPE